METLDKTKWDVVIVGTGLQQSLLALALSRSGKKILHIDENKYYGGAEAALALQEAEEWAQHVDTGSATFSNAAVTTPELSQSGSGQSLASARAYSIEFSPQLLYARSSLLQYLVSSKVYRQLEFLAVGSFWVYSKDTSDAGDASSPSTAEQSSRLGQLLKVPSGREDVFQDQVLDFKAKRALMKFLRFIAEYEEHTEEWEEHKENPFSVFLTEKFRVPAALQAPLLALTLSPSGTAETSTTYALPRVARHLRSIGVFGPGFGAVQAKWGGMSEVVQVACRSCAVGGGVYVLGKGLSNPGVSASEDSDMVTLRLKDGETISTKWVVEEGNEVSSGPSQLCRSITVVSSPLAQLLPPLAEEAPSPASAVVVFPSGSLPLRPEDAKEHGAELPPVHILVFSSDTGECPAGQSILYASTSLPGDRGFQLLSMAVDALLSSVKESPSPAALWSLRYEHGSDSSDDTVSQPPNHVLRFARPSLDLAFDDSALDRVKDVWQRIVGAGTDEFLVFEDREPVGDEDE
ncbi:hypothetical protein M011DRAFT_405435 [Sporormia fimetaria CBS 119925]|uniref:Rab proteins geranylgeranyltransferase n=1 Tax=Sporormia fimetaria CBS 119925 TaxID=1340428 RepID=A0A6A6V8E2_9PLEO|nr:hypothetical protein M011DRAFT_405435 [Sporormia fimetaria CBS 119925]